jgi:hypothetical protein
MYGVGLSLFSYTYFGGQTKTEAVTVAVTDIMTCNNVLPEIH